MIYSLLPTCVSSHRLITYFIHSPRLITVMNQHHSVSYILTHFCISDTFTFTHMYCTVCSVNKLNIL